MDLLFNKNNSGQAEIKKILGFLDGGFTYANLEPDIELNTPDLINLISQEVYDKLQEYYADANPTEDKDIAQAIKYCQLYIASMAYLDYAPNNALTHSNSGRNVSKTDSETMAWDWQIAQDNAATKKRAYKALDLLFVMLEAKAWPEWTGSEAYKKANALFLKNTNLFDAAFPINKSGQLYQRLVPFMADFENDHVTAILTLDSVTTLKAVSEPNETQTVLLNLIHKAIAYLSLGKAMKAFPVEMFPEGLLYNENTRMKSLARAEVMQFLNDEGAKYLTKLEHEYSKQTETFEELPTTNGLEEGKKYVNL
ncbi:DUF6712 family protein [Thalassobellus citreus]|uniref:DUF6712 family protein n=1 Tax=Thalassobellus citreus TaxID=3367752 RepID=UPI0037A68A0E